MVVFALHASITLKETIASDVLLDTTATNLNHSNLNSPVPSVTARQALPIRGVIMIQVFVVVKRLVMNVASVPKVISVSPNVPSVNVTTLAH